MENSAISWEDIKNINEINTRLSEVGSNYLPDLCYHFFPPVSEVVVESKNGKQRIIFYNIEGFSSKEVDEVNKFKQYVRSNGLEIKREYGDSEVLRFLQVSKFEYSKTFSYITKYVEWQNTHIPPIINDLGEQLIRSGYLYIHGRDKYLRPLIVLNPTALLEFKHMDHELIGNEIIK